MMGYRSDVVIGLKATKVLEDNLLKIDKFPKMLQRPGRLKSGNVFYWLFEDIKWYESYTEVSEVIDYLHELDDEEYGFMRIGEENEDVETQGHPYDFDIYFNRFIEFPQGGTVR